MLCGKHGEGNLVTENKGTDIKSGAGCGGYPVKVLFDNSAYSRHKQILGKLGDAHTLVGALHSCRVHIRSEKLNVAVGSAVCLHALEHHLRVMEYTGGRLYKNGLVRNHSAVMPAHTLVVVHYEHMVCKILGKAQLCLILGTLFGMRRSCYGKIVSHCNFSFISVDFLYTV